jgi:heptosyltransferase II
MGDVIIATSLFSYLKNVVSASNIHFLTDANYAGLFKNDPRLEAVVGAEKKLGPKTLGPVFDIHWDMVIDLQNNQRSRRVRKRLGETAKFGFFKKNHGERLLLLWARLNTYAPDDSVAKRYIKAAGFEKDGSFNVPPLRIYVDDEESKRICESLLNGAALRPLIALMPFSTWKNKEWGRDAFSVVGRHFMDKGWDIAILGGPDDRQQALDLQKSIGPRCLALAGQLSLYQCACLLRRCSLALGNDTGLSHLARACGVKTGLIYGSTSSHFGFFPFGDPPFKIFQANIFCRPCHPHGGNFCFLGDRPCLKRIKPESVIQGLEELREAHNFVSSGGA